ncbi:MAG TPA: nicotinate-nucleotide diphosphorylase (carboxylating), partial [bacterium]|nr:nicotinate-nucleotide diphosphorylase (carboxylating) [bacterium]
HRIGLYDMFLIKDNHITASGGIGAAIEKAIEYNRQNNLHLSIEVETKNLDEVREALRYPVQRIMLDNMKIETMREAVAIINKRCETEASGNVSLDTVKDIAETGINFISIGALTHSAPALDLSLLVE